MKKARSWILSLLFPTLSIAVSLVWLSILFIGGYRFVAVHITAFGLFCGGLIPFFMILFLKIDTSKFFVGKLILFAAFAVGVLYALFVDNLWTFFNLSNLLALPILTFIAEAVFAGTRKTDLKTKLCLILSSPIYLYAGFMIDLACTLWRELS